MDTKRALSSVDVRAVVAELRAYEGAKVDKAYLYGDDLVRLKLRDFDRGRVELMIAVGDPTYVRVADPERVPDAPDRPPNFAMMLRNRLSGADLVGVEQHEFDRVTEFTFDRGDGRTRVIAELFGQGNVAVTDGEYEVVDCLQPVRLKSRTVVPGSRYGFPEAQIDPLSMDREAFVALMGESDADLVRTLATQLNFGGLYAEELCARADVEKNTPVAEADEATLVTLHEAIGRLAADLDGAGGDARVYERDGAVFDVTPFPLVVYEGEDSESFDTFTAALDTYIDRLESDDGEEPTDDAPEFEAEIAKRERIIDQQEAAIEDFGDRAAATRRRAELLYERYDLVDEVLATVRTARAEDTPWDEIAARFEEGRERGIAAAEAVESVDGASGTVTIALGDETVTVDPSTGVERNADRLYTDAKGIEEKAEGAREAVADTREELVEWRERKERYERGDDRRDEDDEDDGGRSDEEWLAAPSIPVRKGEQWYEQFRWFRTSDGFLVIGGRNADDNERIVDRYLDPGDRFFHTQAHGGPATVLKATGPSEPARDVEFPESTLRQAAQFGVSYSSVWKDGAFAGDVYAVAHDQVSKTPESGEYLSKGGFAIRGDRTYHEDTPVGVAVGITCEPSTGVIGGPPDAIDAHAVTTIHVEPGRFAQGDAAKRIYRTFRERFADESFVRKVASPDRIQHFLPPGTSRILDD